MIKKQRYIAARLKNIESRESIHKSSVDIKYYKYELIKFMRGAIWIIWKMMK